MLTHLSGMSARCSRDMQVRRSIDAAVVQIRREISDSCSKMADECNEPVQPDREVNDGSRKLTGIFRVESIQQAGSDRRSLCRDAGDHPGAPG
jgi:hypothetical protein